MRGLGYPSWSSGKAYHVSDTKMVSARVRSTQTDNCLRILHNQQKVA